MIQTRICNVLGIQYPIALGGLGGGHTQPAMVAASVRPEDSVRLDVFN